MKILKDSLSFTLLTTLLTPVFIELQVLTKLAHLSYTKDTLIESWFNLLFTTPTLDLFQTWVWTKILWACGRHHLVKYKTQNFSYSKLCLPQEEINNILYLSFHTNIHHHLSQYRDIDIIDTEKYLNVNAIISKGDQHNFVH